MRERERDSREGQREREKERDVREMQLIWGLVAGRNHLFPKHFFHVIQILITLIFPVMSLTIPTWYRTQLKSTSSSAQTCIFMSWIQAITGTDGCQLPSTPMSAHEPQGGNICIVCLHPPRAHSLIYIYVLHLHIWIKYSLAVHLHCNMLTETTISCFL